MTDAYPNISCGNLEAPAGLSRAGEVGVAVRDDPENRNNSNAVGEPVIVLDTSPASPSLNQLIDFINELRHDAASEEAIALKMWDRSQKRANIWGRASAYGDMANRLEHLVLGTNDIPTYTKDGDRV